MFILGIGFLGAVFSFVMLMIFGNLVNIDDPTGMIFYSTFTLSVLISGCSAWIVQSIKKSER